MLGIYIDSCHIGIESKQVTTKYPIERNYSISCVTIKKKFYSNIELTNLTNPFLQTTGGFSEPIFAVTIQTQRD